MVGERCVVTGTCEGATYEPGEPLPPISQPPPAGSIWWAWTAPWTGLAQLTLVPPTNAMALQVAVHTGATLADLQRIPLSGGTWAADFRADAGTTYQFAVTGTGGLELRLSLLALAPNDRFEDCIPLTGTDVTWAASLVVPDTPEPGEPAFHVPGSGTYRGRSVWWTWTAPASGVVELTSWAALEGWVPPVWLGVYRGSRVDQLEIIEQGVYRVWFYAEAGEIYALASGNPEVLEEVSLTLQFAPASRTANDDFADRFPLEGTRLSVDGSTVGATIEPDEPYPGFPPGPGRSVWWTWTAPGNGGLCLTPHQPGVEQLLVYTGASLPDLRFVSPGEGNWGSGWMLVSAGQNYQIRVTRAPPSPYVSYGPHGPVGFDLDFLAASPNDNFADRLLLSDIPVATEGTNVFTSREPGEPALGADCGAGIHSYCGTLWWTWTAPREVLATAVCRGDLAVHTGASLATLDPVASGYYTATFLASAGTTYQIAVAGARSRFTLRLVPPPPNDDFANRTVIPSTPAEVEASFTGSTQEPGEPAFLRTWGTNSVWWSWTAPASGRVTVSVPALESVGLLGVYTGSALDALVEVATNAFRGRVAFDATAGTTYAIGASVWGSVEDLLYLSAPCAPARLDTIDLELPSGDGFRLRVTGDCPGECELECSTNLIDWAVLGEGSLDGGPWTYWDKSATNQTARFYRVVQSP